MSDGESEVARDRRFLSGEEFAGKLKQEEPRPLRAILADSLVRDAVPVKDNIWHHNNETGMNEKVGVETRVLVEESLFKLLTQMAASNPIYMVEEFHRVYGHPIFEKPIFEMSEEELPDSEFERLMKLRQDLIDEEVAEFMEALFAMDTHGVQDAICDIIYVAVGAAFALGLPMRLGMEEVHRSNMSKLGEDGKPIVREDGKILKGHNFEEPNWVKVFEEFAREKGEV